MSAFYGGLAAAAVVTAFVLAATTALDMSEGTTVLVAGALGFVLGRVQGVTALRRLALLAGAGAIAGAALMGAMTAIREAVDLAAPCVDLRYLSPWRVVWASADGGLRGAEIGARLALIAWAVSLIAAIPARRWGPCPRARRC
jgi:hypothetical protein